MGSSGSGGPGRATGGVLAGGAGTRYPRGGGGVLASIPAVGRSRFWMALSSSDRAALLSVAKRRKLLRRRQKA